MNNKKKTRFLTLILLVFLVALTAMQSFAGDSKIDATSFQKYVPGQHQGVEKTEPIIDPNSPLAGERLWPTNTVPFKMPDAPNPNQPAGCQQLIVNSELDVIELGGGTGTAEPWVVLWPAVYYSDTIYVSPIHSLLFIIGDSGDPSPEYDGFGQAFYMPYGLTYVDVTYQRRIDYPNSIDEVFGELWTVDSDGYLDTFITGWTVGDTPSGWGARIFSINDGQTLSQLSGERIALVFANDSDVPTPGEITYFDDIELTACFNPPDFASYLPATVNMAGTGPVCIPPSESPPDTWYTNRGLVQTGANCNSTLSQLDDRDYYSYTPTQSGSHTVHLRNLPTGSNWAALVYNDVEPPPSGPTNGGNCYTSAPGDGDKSIVCNFNAGQNYVIKVSVGDTPISGSYNMQVTRP